jgi:heme exporter protein D
MESLRAFLHMGGYALYVWSSYGLAFVVLIVNVIMPRKREQEFLQMMQRRRKLEDKSR